MDLLCESLFNNGMNNNGDLRITSKLDNISIDVHSFILKMTTAYFDSFNNFKKQNNDNNTIVNLDFESDIIKIVIEYAYNSKKNNPNINYPIQILECIRLIDLLQFKIDTTLILNNLHKKFINCVNKNNFLELITYVYDIGIYKQQQTYLFEYFSKLLQNDAEFIKEFDFFIVVDTKPDIRNSLLKIIFNHTKRNTLRNIGEKLCKKHNIVCKSIIGKGYGGSHPRLKVIMDIDKCKDDSIKRFCEDLIDIIADMLGIAMFGIAKDKRERD